MEEHWSQKTKSYTVGELFADIEESAKHDSLRDLEALPLFERWKKKNSFAILFAIATGKCLPSPGLWEKPGSRRAMDIWSFTTAQVLCEGHPGGLPNKALDGWHGVLTETSLQV